MRLLAQANADLLKPKPKHTSSAIFIDRPRHRIRDQLTRLLLAVSATSIIIIAPHSVH